jgi:hypothetical protein
VRIIAQLFSIAALVVFGIGSFGAGTLEPAGLDLTFTDEANTPVAVIAGATYYIDSLTVMTEIHGDDAGVLQLLETSSEFANLDWSRLELDRTEWISEFDGTYQLQQFYHHAPWMGGTHRFTVTLFGGDEVLAGPFTLETTDEWPAPPNEPFATRRFSAMAFAHGAAGEGDTTGAEFSAQAWLQLRNGVAASGTFSIPARATHLRVEWDHLPWRTLELPLEPVESSDHAYGFEIQVDPAPPASGAYHVPGEEVTFRLTFTDGLGQRLHPVGSLPTYGEFMRGEVSSGLQYYAFFPGIIYYRDKNREGVLLAALTGPSSSVRQTHEPVPTIEFLTQPVQVAAWPERHGFSSLWAIVPPAPIVFGDPAGWDTPVSDQLKFVLPDDALPGEYTFAIKARRLFRGEEALASAVVKIHVGTSIVNDDVDRPLVGNCESCHEGIFDLSRMLHHLDDVTTCTGCHLPLEFERNNVLPHRIHRIHNLSDRYQENDLDCTVCHLDPKPWVEDNARWLVCTGCHDPRQTHLVPFNDLESCSDVACHHTNQRRIHILD